ncbi:MAG TPA: DUF5916 domain-containing protein [Gemmatimonadaceae bacterium]|nr:DUF5916 domain-containing protein [Gemmatimonadaceae bacterium]
MSAVRNLICSATIVAVVVSARGEAQQAAPATSRPVTLSRAIRAAGNIHLDGKLDEAAWAQAPITDSFTQIDPDEGQPASQRTEVRVVFDDDALYVGVRLHDTGPITARLGRRDMSLGDSDWFGVMIDSYHDHRTAFGFDVNPAGVRRDEVKTIDQDDNSWDPVWDVATSVDAAGWTAEYRIPFSQLRFSGDSAQTWGIQFERVIGRRNEYAVSTFIPKSERGGVPRYGHLEGVANVRSGKRLELLPYVVQRAEYVDPGPNPFRTDREYYTSGGLDLLFKVTSNLTLNATINPDFGQVEVDPAVVNLGVYETFFEEKRPFFVEGSEIFAFGAGGTSGGQLFYSRRIGRAPTLGSLGATDMPTNTTILGAGKMSGKVGGWSLGVLTAVTDREEARTMIQEPGLPGNPGRQIVDRTTAEPLATYTVARARRELRDGQTFVGGVLTAVQRDLDTDFAKSVLHRSAIAGGFDFNHQWANRTWVLSGDVEGSTVTGTAAAITRTQTLSNHYFQRPDAEHLDFDTTATSLSGYSMNVTLSKQGGEHWRGDIAGAFTSPGYETNDLGFSYRTDRRDFQTGLRYMQNRPGKRLRNWNLGGSFRSERNFDWEPILTVATMSLNARTLGYWNVHAFAQQFFPAFDDRLTRGGPLARRPGWTSGGAFISSDGRKPISASVFVSGERHQYGAWAYASELSAVVRTSTRWNLTIGPSFFRRHSSAQFVFSLPDTTYDATYDRRYIFAPLDQTELSLVTRFNLTFSPRLSLETYMQPLISSGDFGDAKQLRAPRTYDFIPYSQPIYDDADFDFNFRSLRGNAVLRWEWRAGSTIYFAWQQSRSDYEPVGNFSLGRDRRALFEATPDNIFLVKVNYWLNP